MSVADNVGYAVFPNKEGVDNHGNWLWSWNLGIPESTDAPEAAKAFVTWATSKEYTQLVAEKQGWRAAPPGTRSSLYENETYLEEAPFATLTKQTMDAATPEKPSVQMTRGIAISLPGPVLHKGVGGLERRQSLVGKTASLTKSFAHHIRNLTTVSRRITSTV